MNTNATTHPLISIIIPVYNTEKYITRCLNSIKSQTFTNYECICIDDGSKDNSGKICDEYAKNDSRFITIHKGNGGVSSARNLGINNAKGDFITFIDSDDWIENDYCEHLYNVTVEKNADITFCSLIYERKKERKKEANIYIPSSDEDLFRLMCTGKLFCGSVCKLIKKSLFTDYNISFSNGIIWSEDKLLFSKLFYHTNKIAFTDKCLYHYDRTSESSVTNNAKKDFDKLESIKKVVSEIENYISPLDDYKNETILLMKADFKLDLIVSFQNTSKDFYKEVINTYKEVDSFLLSMCNSKKQKLFLCFALNKHLTLLILLKKLNTILKTLFR